MICEIFSIKELFTILYYKYNSIISVSLKVHQKVQVQNNIHKSSVQLETKISKSQLILNSSCVICYRSYPKHEEMLASCLTLEIREFRCREAKIEESEKVSSHWESNPRHLWIEPPASVLPLSYNHHADQSTGRSSQVSWVPLPVFSLSSIFTS